MLSYFYLPINPMSDTLPIILQIRQGTEMLSNLPGFAQLINDRAENCPWSA